MLKVLLALFFTFVIYSTASTASGTDIDATGIFYGEPQQFAWVIFNPGPLPDREITAPLINMLICNSISEDSIQMQLRLIPIKYPLLVKVNQWTVTNRGGYVSTPMYTQEIVGCPKVRQKLPKIPGEREA